MNRFRVTVEGIAHGATVLDRTDLSAASPGEALNAAIANFAVRYGVSSRCDRAHLEVIRSAPAEVAPAPEPQRQPIEPTALCRKCSRKIWQAWLSDNARVCDDGWAHVPAPSAEEATKPGGAL